VARAQSRGLISAPPALVYAVLADYLTHHPQIMPPALFSRLQVEQGGVGAGTVFHITLTLLGRSQLLNMQVSEPEPGRLLAETNRDTGAVTTFRVEPAGQDRAAHVTIASQWVGGGGLRGLLDSLLTPLLLGYIFRQQLASLERYVQVLG
jgi:Polyketide cyclase / dehydrase and lipid transport